MAASGGASSSAVVVAGDEETRVLLRGLLRLHHFRVDGEAEGATQGLDLVREHRPGLLVADVNLAEGSSTHLVAESRKEAPGMRVILVAPASRPPNPPSSPDAGPDVVLLRPFRIRQFAEALLPSASSAGTPPNPGPP
jgi:DNA-binding NarL/FixJ family response regulator